MEGSGPKFKFAIRIEEKVDSGISRHGTLLECLYRPDHRAVERRDWLDREEVLRAYGLGGASAALAWRHVPEWLKRWSLLLTDAIPWLLVELTFLCFI